MGKCKFLPIPFLSVLLLVGCGNSASPPPGPLFTPGTTIFVDVANTTGVEDGSEAHPFNTIQEGIDAATSGDVVGVATGTYVESVTLKSEIELLGVDKATTIIDGENDEGAVVALISVSDVRVSGFTIRGAIADGELPGGAGIFVDFPATSIQIDDNILTANDIGIGILNASLGAGGPAIDRNLISQNNFYGILDPGTGPITNNVIADNGWFGILKEGNSAASVITNNTIVNNRDDGIRIFDDRVTTITNNIMSGHRNFGIDVRSANNPSAERPLVAFNLFFNNRDGNFSDIDSPLGSNATLNTAVEINSLAENSDNIVVDPQFVNPSLGDFRLAAGSPAIDAGTNTGAPATDFAGNSRPIDGDGDDLAIVDMGAFERGAPRRQFDCPSGDVDCLINAINTVNTDGEASTINLAAGVYTLGDVNDTTNGPSGLPSITSPITITGTGGGATIIERHPSAVPFRILHVAGGGDLAIDQLTIRGGDTGGASGGGIFNLGTLTLTNSTVSNNSALGSNAQGGGIWNGGLGTVNNSTVSGNSANIGGGLFNNGGLVLNNSTVDDCVNC